jgi:hypothetical protein
MNSQKYQKEIKIFEGKTHTGVMQDKYPPGRITAGMKQPATATVVADFNPRVSTSPHRLQTPTPLRRIPARNTTDRRRARHSRSLAG